MKSRVMEEAFEQTEIMSVYYSPMPHVIQLCGAVRQHYFWGWEHRSADRLYIHLRLVGYLIVMVVIDWKIEVIGKSV